MKEIGAISGIRGSIAQEKLRLLTEALGPLPDGGRAAVAPPTDRALAGIDPIVDRARKIEALLERESGTGWDQVDVLAAQMLLRDLAAICRELRALAAVVSQEFRQIEEALRDGEHVVNHVKGETTPEDSLGMPVGDLTTGGR